MTLASFFILILAWLLSTLSYYKELSNSRKIIRQNENITDLCKQIINLNTELCNRNEMMTEMVRQILGYSKEEEQNAEDT